MIKLTELKIDGYRNLAEEAVFDFQHSTNYVALIGLNGSGKSNVMEAIAKVFYSFQPKAAAIPTKADGGFDFKLRYTLEGKEIVLENAKISVAGKVRKRTYSQFLPTELIACYSGEETRLWDGIFAKPYLDYFSRIRQNFLAQKLNYLYINKFCWETALITLLCHQESKVKTLALLGLDTDIDIDIDFYFPNDYDSRKAKFEATGANQLTTGFTDRLKDYQANVAGGEGVKISQIDTLELGEANNKKYCQLLFNYLFLATMPKTKKLITKIDIRFGSKNVKSLSEGEKKIILISVINQVLAGENSVVLLDEPDAHVHLEKKKDILDTIEEGNHLSLFTTHSPTVCKYCLKENVFQLVNGKVTPLTSIYEGIEYLIDKTDVLKTMFSSKDIIICEGKTDDIYISKAFEHFKEDYPALRFDFMRVGGTDSENIKHVLDKFGTERDKKIIVMVDRDPAGLKVYNSLFPDSAKAKGDIDFQKYDNRDNVFFLMIPPINAANKSSDFQIENYFTNETIKKLAVDHITTSFSENVPFTGFPRVADDIKTRLLKEYCESSTPQQMEGFKTLLDKLNEIIQS